MLRFENYAKKCAFVHKGEWPCGLLTVENGKCIFLGDERYSLTATELRTIADELDRLNAERQGGK